MDQTVGAGAKFVPTNAVLWGIVGISAGTNVVAGLFTDAWPPALLATLVTLPLVVFAFAHGSAAYGWRSMAAFAVICFVVTNSLEHLSILTGFPFGRYQYGDALGPKLFLVPVLIAPAYFAMAYLSWMLGRLLLGCSEQQLPGRAPFVLPAVASLLLVSWNASYDPLISTVRQGWTWLDGGAYLGVPVSNFVGWYLTSYVSLQIFALYLRREHTNLIARRPSSSSYCLQPVVLYGAVPAIIILAALTTTGSDLVTDQAGVAWRVGDIYTVCALVSTLTMGTFSILALAKILGRPAADN